MNKPVPLSFEKSTSRITGKQTAAQCLCLLRLLPLMIVHLIPENDSYWLLYIIFLNILDYILVPLLDRGQFKHLEYEISFFLTDFYTLTCQAKGALPTTLPQTI